MRGGVLEVSTWRAQAVAWVSIAFFAVCTVLAWADGERATGVGFLVFFAMGVAVLLTAGPVSATAEGLSVRCPHGTFGMRWADVRRIEWGSGQLVLFGEVGRRLLVIAPGWWSGPDRGTLIARLDRMIDQHQIPWEVTFRADYFLLSKNTRIAGALGRASI